MPCCKSHPPDSATRRRVLGGLLTGAALGWASLAHAGAPGVDELRVERSDEGLFLYAQLSFELAPSVQDALLKGIPIHFVAEARVLRERWYWFDQPVATAQRFTRIAYQPLTRHWRISTSSEPLVGAEYGLGLTQQYDSLADVLSAVQRIAGWKIASAGELSGSGTQILQFQFRLDASQLPRTFQLGAVRQSDWHLQLERRLVLSPERGS